MSNRSLYLGLSLGMSLWVGATTANAHGLMESPMSRNWFCGVLTKPDETSYGNPKYPECATAFKINSLAGYNYMSVVTHTLGRASVTPLPAHVCGFAGETWKGAETPWDVPMQWPTNPMTSGPRDITWDITTGPHFDDTDDLSYWITKADFVFSPTKALTWNDFEDKPFCVERYNDKDPLANPKVTVDKNKGKITSRCTIPSRSGHHVIYGEWGRLPPTLERFHGCIDAQFATAGIRNQPKAWRPSIKTRIDALGRTPSQNSPTRFIFPIPVN